MKKTYKAPTMLVTEIHAEELICLSMVSGPASSQDALVRERGSRTSYILDDMEE